MARITATVALLAATGLAAAACTGYGSSSVPASAPETSHAAAPKPSGPRPGSVIARFHGHGNFTTRHFKVPANGVYDLSWRYSGNSDSSFGQTMPDNFIISNTGDGMGETPNDVAASGSGSTEVTGATGTDSFNVQSGANSTVTITVTVPR